MPGSETTHAFDGRAADYARHRFDYAPEAIDAIVAIAGLGPASTIADLGAGTGMLSQHLARRGACVYAVEPNAEMRAEAIAHHQALASLHVIDGTAHATGLPEASVDAVTAGRAVQWFDRTPTEAEIRRVLRPGGWLVIVRTPVAETHAREVLEPLRALCTTRGATGERHRRAEGEALAYFGGDNCIRLSFPQSAQETWPQFLGRLHSLSYAPRPGDPEHESFVQHARALFDARAVEGRLHVAYATQVLMKQMTPAPSSRPRLAFDEREIEGDVVTRFERVVDADPDAIAIRADGAAWRYRDLDARANAIAGRVVAASPDRTRPVALLFGHGASGIVAMLGVLKAGRSYCALAPAAPLERQRAILDDLAPALLLCDDDRRAQARELASSGLQVDVVDPQAFPGYPVRPRIPAGPGDVAAICYTSGTTGSPKGLALPHRYFLHRVWLSAPMLELGPGVSMSQIPELAYATAASDVTLALLSGATLCPFDVNRHGLAGMARWIRDERLEVVRMPVALFHRFCEALADDDRFPDVRILHPAGKLAWTAVERFRHHFPHPCRLLRQLASTECGVIASMLLGDDAPAQDGDVPVGHPVPGKDIWLEKEDGAIAGVGEVGEIVVRSRCLFAGVWGRPDTWLPAGEPRVHRTGDLGCWLPGGLLAFVGRTDARVKIRGFTVDCEHVESALEATGLVTEAAVVAREDDERLATLVAYVVPKDAQASPATLRTRLAHTLPDAMIPARFIALDALPRTPTGKVHRVALAARPLARAHAAGTSPRSPLEAGVAAIWQEALALDALDIDDDFRDLGGDSLVAARIASRVLRAYGVALSPRELFLAPTVARMAALIAQREAEPRPAAPGPIPTRRRGRDTP